MELGDLELTLVSDGEFRLDGGAMFGVVPRVMWEKASPPDEKNRIRMGTNCLLVKRGSDLLLIDTGIGDKNDRKFQENYGMDPEAVRLPESIRRAGYELEDVTHVLLSHLHFDHCGWNTRVVDGRVVPTFPKARYWLNRGEVEHARSPNERDRASYFPDNWEPLFEAGVAELFDDEAEPLPGVKAVRVPGHNGNMCVVVLDGGGGEKAVFWADLVPTAAHVPYPWIMSYDLYPLTTLENKKLWLPRAVEGNWLCIFEHDPRTPAGRLQEEKPGRYRAVPVETPAPHPVRA
ncbi:MAG TPA: MBL fold metallo-hydrolase [Thermoanaerobaculia bacterium]|nr:MBL fold metallo-hydrolase [Thermoanaerobaculia bacterium]